jgi:hypothetical protein
MSWGSNRWGSGGGGLETAEAGDSETTANGLLIGIGFSGTVTAKLTELSPSSRPPSPYRNFWHPSGPTRTPTTSKLYQKAACKRYLCSEKDMTLPADKVLNIRIKILFSIESSPCKFLKKQPTLANAFVWLELFTF